MCDSFSGHLCDVKQKVGTVRAVKTMMNNEWENTVCANFSDMDTDKVTSIMQHIFFSISKKCIWKMQMVFGIHKHSHTTQIVSKDAAWKSTSLFQEHNSLPGQGTYTHIY